MTTLLQKILDGADKALIRREVRSGASQIPLFEPIKELKNKTLYEYLTKYQKIKNWSLEDFIDTKAVDLDETDPDGMTLMQFFLEDNEIDNVKILLLKGVRFCEEDYRMAGADAQDFLDYRPGDNQKSIFEYCSKRIRNPAYLQALLLDQADTTSDESSSAASMSEDDFSDTEQEEYDEYRKKEIRKYNKKPKSTNAIRLVAARGVHFSGKYFSQDTIENCIETRDESFAAFSPSTLFDAGYTADDDVHESDPQIQARHKKNLQFIKELKDSPDKKEKRIPGSAAPVTRNNQKFENLYYRFMQVYINSYDRLLNKKSIQIDFGFDTSHNLEVSASWIFAKAAMYGSGYRFDWEAKGIRKDPHYRRTTGKAKHPNMGYIDIYAFDPAYVKANGFDRQLMCRDEQIKLNSLFRFEAEIIFHSMIPAEFHLRRCIITLPSFDNEFDKNKFALFGINSKAVFTRRKNEILSLPAKKSDKYHECINKITEQAAETQAGIIERTVHCRLFRAKQAKVVAYDHGDKLDSEHFKL